MYSSLLGSTFPLPPHIHGPKCVHDSVSIWKTPVHSCTIPSVDPVQGWRTATRPDADRHNSQIADREHFWIKPPYSPSDVAE